MVSHRNELLVPRVNIVDMPIVIASAAFTYTNVAARTRNKLIFPDLCIIIWIIKVFRHGFLLIAKTLKDCLTYSINTFSVNADWLTKKRKRSSITLLYIENSHERHVE